MSIVLPSRGAYKDPEHFVRDFLETLTPAVIPRSEFINWDKLTIADGDALALRLLETARQQFLAGQDLRTVLAGLLFEHPDQAESVLRLAFGLLAHTSDVFATREDFVCIPDLARRLRVSGELDRDKIAFQIADILSQVGLNRVLAVSRLEDYLLGVKVGLETHRRKNRGGTEFAGLLEQLIREEADDLRLHTGHHWDVRPDYSILYGPGLTKKVDYALLCEGRCRFGFEVNFYVSSGSKPTEIKRSYADIGRGLLSEGVLLLWITDGAGYYKMRRSLRDAYAMFPNIYNLRQAQDALALDLRWALSVMPRN